jgi:riboflavin biosynthesis pyrimidine reductase
MVIFIAPKIIGGDGISVIAACGVETMAQAIPLRDITSWPVGDDLMLTAYLVAPGQSGRFPSQTEEA